MSTSIDQKEKRSKWRLSNRFNRDKDSSLEQPHNSASDYRDSAYGGSETTSDASPNPSSQAVPTISQDQADMQGAPVETRTDAKGKVVTTTTTTVTTTTTTTGGDSLQVPAGEEVIVRKEESTTPGPIELNGQSRPVINAPSIPARNDLRNRSPHGGHLAPQNQHLPTVTSHNQHPSAPSPVASPTSSAPMAPASPTHQNFSYPGRQAVSPTGHQNPAHWAPPNGNRPRPPMDPAYGQPPLNENAVSPQSIRMSQASLQYPANSGAAVGTSPYQQRQSTAQSIRTAAAGLHGAGEAIRGAVNSNVARRTGASAEEIAKHDAVMERGRREIETGQIQRASNAPPVPDAPVEPIKEKKSRGLRNVLRRKSQERTA